MAVQGKVAIIGPPEVVKLPFWKEAFAGIDYLRLKASGVYYGFGVPRGNGTPVVIVPGFMGADFYLLEMYWWLKRMGYVPYFSRIGHNAKCPDMLTHRLLDTVNRAFAETGQPVHIIGHSFGGVLARAVAYRKPERIISVTMLGSPFGGTKVNSYVMGMIGQVKKYTLRAHGRNSDCYSVDCHCGFVSTMQNAFPRSVPETAIYTKDDGVVAWEACVTANAENNIEVSGTHTGLAWNPEVYRIVANRLHESNEKMTMRRINGTLSTGPSEETRTLTYEKIKHVSPHTMSRPRAKGLAAASPPSRADRGKKRAAA